MGWFEDQVKKRKELDAKTFQESFMSLAGLLNNTDNLSEREAVDNFAIKQILAHFRHQMVDIPTSITKFKDKLDYA